MRTIFIALLLALAACAPSTDAPSDDPATPEADLAVVRASLTRSLSRAPSQLRTRMHADGSSHVQITGGFLHHSVLVRGDAGVARHCVSDPGEALRLIEGSTP